MKFVLYILIFISFITANNNHPIILIHGFLGWGRDEMPGYYYWGGRTDLETLLQGSGHKVFSVSVGPISSNYDRAIEAYYQIKGGQLDYGKHRSDSLGIIQKPGGKYYSGLYPNWDEKNPIHIIGHSQGGQTAKQLEVLLKEISDIEESFLLSNNLNGWIKSITTISTPHNGTTLVPIMLNIFPFLLDMAPWVAGIDINAFKEIYNFDLEHWGIDRGPKESLLKYYDRIGRSPLANSKNLCSWDLSPEGAHEFNKKYENDQNVYYFSFATSATSQKKYKPFHKPNKNMSLHLRPMSRAMGNYINSPDSTWFENDGICNTVSMDGPSNQKIILYNAPPIKGVWQKMQHINMDHQAIIGHMGSKTSNQNIVVLYNKHIELLKSLH